MPTGYTEGIARGITFQEFAMKCARAFGVLITMRDAPLDEPIPDEFQPSGWHVKELAKAELRLKELTAMTLEEAKSEASRSYRTERGRIAVAVKESQRLTQQYLDMLVQVKTWVPPTPEHEGLQEFMISQIKESIRFDYMGDYYKKNPAVRLSGVAWLEKERDKAKWSIAYHSEEKQKEIDRVRERNQWVKALRDSLPNTSGG